MRIFLLDIARGVCVLAMIAYHFCWDLGYFGFVALRTITQGLGLFIAKTLLERTGATLLFSNSNAITKEIQEGEIKKGAIVEVCWPKNLLQLSDYNSRNPLPKNVKN